MFMNYSIPPISTLFQNYVLDTALLAWFSAQVIKTLITFIKTKEFNLERMFGAGGMPSAHTATVCSLVIAISRHSGFSSVEFAIAFVLAAVVMYDATGVRRAAGEHAKVLNEMVKNRKENESDEGESAEPKELKEFLGHTPLEVLGGALLGIIIAMIIPVK